MNPVYRTKKREREFTAEELDDHIEKSKLLPNGWFFWDHFETRRSRVLSIRLLHLYNLINLLKTSLLEQNYERANRILVVLTENRELAVSAIWELCVKVVQELSNHNDAVVKLLNFFLGIMPNRGPELILELAFYHVHCENAERALELLEPWLYISPYQENPLIQGYIGVLAYGLWHQENLQMNIENLECEINPRFVTTRSLGSSKKRSRDFLDILNSDEENEDDDEKEYANDEGVIKVRSDKHLHYYQVAIHALKASLKLDLSNDMFLTLYLRLCASTKQIEEPLLLINQYINEYPTMLTGYRLLFEVLFKYKNHSDEEWLEAGKLYHRMDPASPDELVLKPLCDHYKEIIAYAEEDDKPLLIDAHLNIAELILQRIEHGDDRLSTLQEVVKRILLLDILDPTSHKPLFSSDTGRDTWMGEYIYRQGVKLVDSHLKRDLYSVLGWYSDEKSKKLFAPLVHHTLIESWKRIVLDGQDIWKSGYQLVHNREVFTRRKSEKNEELQAKIIKSEFNQEEAKEELLMKKSYIEKKPINSKWRKRWCPLKEEQSELEQPQTPRTFL
ncbi:hypothetical protein G9A89_013747 [Geosiphon pyriformis]|nr:hypothetical protein G9A89_013747 [Geosiphon pyriformis]